MALLQMKQRISGSIPTSSMADVAFLLLVFFLVTTVFDDDKGLQMVLPEARAEEPIAPKNLLLLQIRPDGLVEIRRGESPQVQMVAATAVGGVWRTEVRENPRLIAALQTHPETRYGHMIEVLDQLREAGATRISLQRLEP
jgi:biopolymer transport protein ExbD